MGDFLGRALAMIWPGLSPQTQRRVGAFVLVVGLVALVGLAFLQWTSIYRDIFPSPTSAPITASNNSGGQNGNVTNKGPVYNGPVTVQSAKDCPPRYLILQDSLASENKMGGYKIDPDAKVCLVRDKATKNGGYGFDVTH